MQVLNIVNSQVKAYFNGEPLYMLNGYPVLSAESLLSIDPTEIDSIQVVKKNAAAIFGRLAQYGMVAVFTSQDAPAFLLPQEGNWLPPVSLVREVLLEEKYGNSLSHKPEVPQLEALIKWSEDIAIGPDGGFTFELQTSHEAGDFIVELTGIYPDGEIIRLTHILQVNSDAY